MPPRRRFFHPLWLILSLPLYVGWRLLPALAMGPLGLCAGSALLIGACIAVPLSVRRTDRFAWVGLLAMGFFSTLFVATLLRDLFLLIARCLLTGSQYAALLTPS